MTTVTISLEVLADLAKQLTPFQDRLSETIELGLHHWQDVETTSLTPRRCVEQIWTVTGLIVSLDPTIISRYPKGQERRTPILAGGKPIRFFLK